METRALVPSMSRASKLAMLGAWLFLVLIGFSAVFWMAQEEISRQEAEWENRLEMLSASQSRNVGGWIAQRREALANLADNLSLKLYMTELSAISQPQDFGLEEPAQLMFLRNLIFSTAANNGFGGMAQPDVRANTDIEKDGGIMLLNVRGEALVMSRNMPALSQLPTELQAAKDAKEPLFSGPFLINDQQVAVAFRQPVMPVQAEDNATPIGQIMAVATLDDKFFRLLEPAVPQGKTAEGLLVSWDDSELTYFSNPKDTQEPMAQRAGQSDPATVAAIQSSGRMVGARDARERQVFAIAQPVENARGWWLIRKVERRAALGDALQRTRLWKISYLLCAALLTAAAIAFFRHQSALRAKEAARHYRSLANRIERQEQLLTLIAETSPVATYILDAEERLRYANRRAAEACGMDRESLIGKGLIDILGAARAESILRVNKEALEGHASRSSLEQEVVDDLPVRALAREHIPLYAIPFGDAETTQPGVLVLESDVTSLIQSQEKQQRTLHHLIRTMVAIVDKRDPHAAHHSACVSMIAEAVAHTMQLASPYPEAAAVAGQLLNLGKILVPEELLTAKSLKADERERIRASLKATADLLQGIDFTGPVVETIRQSQESVDGSGPLGLKGDAILISARIVHAANNFVALISARAYRSGKSVDEALKILLEGIDTQFDRSVVAALVTYMDNGGGRTALTDCLKEAA